MQAGRAVFLALVASLLVSSCSRQPILFLVNHTGAQVDVLHVVAPGVEGDSLRRSLWEILTAQPLRVRDGTSRPISTAGWVLENRRWTIELRAGDCRLSFEVPFDVGHHYHREVWWAWSNRGAHGGDPHVQLERDKTLHLFPGGSTIAQDVTLFIDIQPEGFPLSPTDAHCG